MRQYRYTIILQAEPEEGGYSVTVPALPGCVAQGESLEEAITLAKEAIALHVTGLIEDGEPVPEEPEPLQALSVRVAAQTVFRTFAAPEVATSGVIVHKLETIAEL